MTRFNFLSGASAVALTLLCAAGVMAQPTAFRYQGLLSESGVPFTGALNLDCALWDDPTAGAQVGPTVNLPGVSVTEGLFAVRLDFGAGVFNGAGRWLAISVNGTPLTPRQELTPTPYALYALGGAGVGLTLPFSGSGAFNGTALAVTNSHASGRAIAGRSTATGLGFPQPIGVYGESSAENGRGLVGSAPGGSGFGVIGSGGQAGVSGSGYTGVSGGSNVAAGRGVFGGSVGLGQTYGGYFDATHPFGLNGANGTGVYGRGGTGVFGETSISDGTAVRGVTGNTGGFAGFFQNQTTNKRVELAGPTGAINTNGFLYREYTASTRSAAIPLAYGVVNADGTIASGTGNFTASVQTEGFGQTYFVISVTGEWLDQTVTAIITPYGHTGTPRLTTGWLFAGGAMQVRHLTSGSGVLAQTFSFVLFRAAPAAGGGFSSLASLQTPIAQPGLVEANSETPTVCSGNAVTDERGYATVSLPDGFEAPDRDFRYQLTIVDDGADRDEWVMARVARALSGNQFRIRTSVPNIRVSWQVSGVR